MRQRKRHDHVHLPGGAFPTYVIRRSTALPGKWISRDALQIPQSVRHLETNAVYFL